MYVRFVLVRIFGYILIPQDSSDTLKHYPTRTFADLLTFNKDALAAYREAAAKAK